MRNILLVVAVLGLAACNPVGTEVSNGVRATTVGNTDLGAEVNDPTPIMFLAFLLATMVD